MKPGQLIYEADTGSHGCTNLATVMITHIHPNQVVGVIIDSPTDCGCWQTFCDQAKDESGHVVAIKKDDIRSDLYYGRLVFSEMLPFGE